MSTQSTSEPESPEETMTTFENLLSDEDLATLLEKYGLNNLRDRKLPVRWFFWLMVLSAGEPSRRGSILQLIGFFLGAIALLFPNNATTSLSKNAVSKRLRGVSWYLFRGAYNHLLEEYRKILPSGKGKFLGKFKDAFCVDGSIIALCKQMEKTFRSTHKGKSSLKLNAKFSLKLRVVTKLQVSDGKRHDSRFAFVTRESRLLYLVDLGYWSFKLMKKIMDAGSFFVMRLKSSCDPLIVAVSQAEFQHLVGKRLSEMGDFLKEHTRVGVIDLTVQLSKAKKPRFKKDVRLVGLFYEGAWRYYVTNIVDPSFTPQMIYDLYAQRWQVEIFFNVLKNVLNLQTIISRNKNGIMIEIYSALILYLLTQIIIALAAKKTDKSIHEFSFERSFKIVKGFLVANLRLFFKTMRDINPIFQRLIDTVALMGLRHQSPQIILIEKQLP